MNTNNLKQWILESIYSRLIEQDDDTGTKSVDKTVKGRGTSGRVRKSRKNKKPNPEDLKKQADARDSAKGKPSSGDDSEAKSSIQKDTEKEDQQIRAEQGDTGASPEEVKSNIEKVRAEKIKKSGKKRAGNKGPTTHGRYSAEVLKAKAKRTAKIGQTFDQTPPSPSHDSGVPHRKGVDKESDKPQKHIFKNPEGGETKRAVAINRLSRRGYVKRDDRGHLVYGDKHPAAGQTVRGKLGHFFRTGNWPKGKGSSHPDVKKSKSKKPKLTQSQHGTRDPKFMKKEAEKENKAKNTYKF